ncbi:MAG: hypothetical protein ABEI77_10625 [Halorientalis sp.]
MAFWMDPLLLVAIGVAIAWLTKEYFDGSNLAVYGFEAVTLAGTYLLSIGLFLNVVILHPVWTALGAESGTAFMINGWLFGFVDPATTWRHLGTGPMFVAILLFALYPFCLRLGVLVGRVLVGHTADQDGLVGLVSPG